MSVSAFPRARWVAASILILSALACGDDRVATPPPADLKVEVHASRADAVLMVRTPTAPYGEREGNTIDLDAFVANPRGHVLENKQHIDWASSDTGVATVDSVGVVTAQGVGDVLIFVDHKKSVDTVHVRVVPVPVASVAVTGPDSISLDDEVSFSAATLDSAGAPLLYRSVTWHSSNGAVASVDQTGAVKGLTLGTVTIDATSEGQTGSAPLQVWPQPVASIEIDPASVSLPLYRSAALTAKTRDRYGKLLTDRPVTWTSSAVATFTVDASGPTTTVNTVSPGDGTVTATSENVSTTAAVTVTNPVEARALWVNRFEYSGASSVSAARIATIFQRAASANFNIVYFQVRTAGDALYASDIEPCSPRLCGTLGGTRTIDPLAIAITEANKYGIEVHAWLNSFTGWIAGSTAACNQLLDPVTPRHMTKANPSWNMLLANGTEQPCATTQEYVWVSPGHPGARKRLADVAVDIATRYAVKGIHLDRIRYPTTLLSYDTASTNEYRRRNNGAAPVAGSVAWANFRRGFVNDAVKEVYDRVKAVNPSIVISAAVWPVYKTVPGWASSKGYDDYFQDPRAWALGGYLDVAAPMTYPATRTTTTYTVMSPDCAPLSWTCLLNLHRATLEDTAKRHVYIGIGAIKGWEEVQKQMDKARSVKATGYSFYSYSQVDTLLFAPGQPQGAGWGLIREKYFKYPAVVPSMPWKTTSVP